MAPMTSSAGSRVATTPPTDTPIALRPYANIASDALAATSPPTRVISTPAPRTSLAMKSFMPSGMAFTAPRTWLNMSSTKVTTGFRARSNGSPSRMPIVCMLPRNRVFWPSKVLRILSRNSAAAPAALPICLRRSATASAPKTFCPPDPLMPPLSCALMPENAVRPNLPNNSMAFPARSAAFGNFLLSAVSVSSTMSMSGRKLPAASVTLTPRSLLNFPALSAIESSALDTEDDATDAATPVFFTRPIAGSISSRDCWVATAPRATLPSASCRSPAEREVALETFRSLSVAIAAWSVSRLKTLTAALIAAAASATLIPPPAARSRVGIRSFVDSVAL